MKNRMFHHLFAVVLMAATAAAAADSRELPSPDDVLRVPPELAQLLKTRVLPGTLRAETRRDRLLELYFRDWGLNLQYQGQPTLTLAESFEQGKGNCLSFTLMFIALAREAGMEAWAREVSAPLVWTRDGDLLFSTTHVNAGLHMGNYRMVVDFEPDPLLAQRLARRGRQISDERALAHFYNNRGAELLAEGDLQGARAHLEQALELDPTFTPALNNSGVLARRLGDPAAAEQAFAAALEHDQDNVSALFNLIALHRRTGNHQALAVWQARLDATRPRDPYYQLEIGRRYEDAGDLHPAYQHYRRAARLAPGDHHLQFALARIHYRIGNRQRAERAFQKALELSASSDTRSQYQAKLKALRSLHGDS